MKKSGELVIKNIRTEKTDDGSRLVACVCHDGREKDVWFQVQRRYADYLTSEVCDAFVVGFLNFAQRKGFDIVCDTPISAELKYRLESFLIPSLAKHGKRLYATRIIAPVFEGAIPNERAVGTGISCGIDSFHVLKNHLDHPVKALRLTHLVINNVGAFRTGSGQYDRSVVCARAVAREVGLELVETDSNIFDVWDCEFVLLNTYANMFGVLALRKLWGVFYYGSCGFDLGRFSLKDNDEHDCGHYDLMTAWCLSTMGLAVYTEGAARTRFEKTLAIKDYDIAKRHLNVCVNDEGGNCSTCEKCRRTLLIFDALGCLAEYADVFNLARYYKNRVRFVGWALYRRLMGTGGYTNEALKILLPRYRLRACCWAVAYFLKRLVAAK